MCLLQRIQPVIFLFILFILFCSQPEYQFSDKYDPQRDPFKDVEAAVKMAQKSGKRILLKVGGEWCPWCHLLDDFIENNEDVKKMVNENFILLKINYSKENKNTEFLSQYPKIPGYPHFFVLDSDGTFLHSQGTGVLELGKGYDKEKVMNFLRQWAPKKH